MATDRKKRDEFYSGNGQAKRKPRKGQYNPELGKQVAGDAQNVVAGRLSEADFHQKYHESYLNEFGFDNRPTTSESIFTKEISRRTLFMLGGVTLASLLVARSLGGKTPAAAAANGNGNDNLLLKAKEEPPAQPIRVVQKGLVVDLENCDGCLQCVYACQNHNFNPPGVLWIYVLAYKDENQDGRNFLLRTCQHCGNPPCVKVCPARARHKREKDGLVLTDYDLCIGCRYCMVTCPYGVNYFQWDEPTRKNIYHEKLTDYRGRWVIGNPPRGCMGKCTFCPDRQDDGRNNLVCELACPHNVLHFGDLNDPNDKPQQYLAKRTKETGGKLTTFRLLENQGTKPSVIYIGQQPTRSARPVDGPVTYADWGLVEERKPQLAGPEPWFMKAFGGKP